METIKQTDIAAWVGVSPQFICDIKKGRRYFSKTNAEVISAKTGIPFRDLAMTNGDKLYQKLVLAFGAIS